MKQNKSELIQNGDVYKVLLTLSIPIMINSIIQTLYNLVDGVWVSRISSVHFAAVSFVSPINFLFIALGMGLSVAGTSLLSQLLGAGRFKDAKEYTSQLMAASFFLSVVFVIIGVATSSYIIRYMGGEGYFADLSNTYLRISFLDLPFMFLYFNVNSIMNSQGNTVTPTILSAISALINVVLDPIFIFTFDMGIAGAAWATVLSRIVLALLGIRAVFKEDNYLKPTFRGFKADKNILMEIVRVGLPASIGQAGASVGFMFLNGFIVSYGTATIAAFGMVNRITSLVIQPAMGVGAALTAVVGQNLGARRSDRATESFKEASKLALYIGVIGGVLMFVFNEQIVNFFIQSKDEPEVIMQGMTYMKYIAFSMPLMGIFSVLQGIFQGSGNTKYSMAMEIGRLWAVRLPMILIFKNFSDFGPSGIWFSMSFSNLIVCIYGLWVYKVHGWNRKAIKISP